MTIQQLSVATIEEQIKRFERDGVVPFMQLFAMVAKEHGLTTHNSVMVILSVNVALYYDLPIVTKHASIMRDMLVILKKNAAGAILNCNDGNFTLFFNADEYAVIEKWFTDNYLEETFKTSVLQATHDEMAEHHYNKHYKMLTTSFEFVTLMLSLCDTIEFSGVRDPMIAQLEKAKEINARPSRW